MADTEKVHPAQGQPSKPPPSPSSSSPATSTLTKKTTGSSLFPYRIPAPLQRLFERFPLLTYPPNDLPARCPLPGRPSTLHVFISTDDAARGSPSYNPTCLKWQTFLRIAGVAVTLVPSTNHASPSGALPFLLPARQPPPSAADIPPPSSPPPVPAHKLHAYALAHGTHPPPSTSSPATTAEESAYFSLLDHPIRLAWLHALYISPSNAPLLESLYLAPSTRSPAVRRVLRAQLRAAVASELASSHNGVDPPSDTAIYADARAALADLAALLGGNGSGRSSPRWFAGPDGPGLLDAAVFAYTYLLLPASRLQWGDRALCDLVEAFPALVAHVDRMVDWLWAGGRERGSRRRMDDSVGDWEKV